MEKMQKDYNELWLEAMDSLISARLRDLPYDKTFVCTITDDSEKDKGFYTVTDGTIEFQAYSEKTDYANNNQVYVTVPMGNMQYDRYIIGRYISDSDNDSIVYVTPVEKVAPVHVMHDEDFTKAHKVQHTAYDSKAVVLFNGALPVPIDTEVCDTVAIRAKFKTPVNWATIPMDMSSAEYGIRLYAYTDGESSTKASFMAELNSTQDMFGNPFGYVAPMLQQQAFRFTSSIGTLRFAKVEVYYKGPVKNLEGAPYYEDIEISDIEIFFGADVSTVQTDTVKIYTNDSLTYSDTSGISKTVNLIWYNKTPENKLIGFTDGVFDKDKAKDVKNIPEGDEGTYYWIDWLVDNNNGSLEIIDVLGDTQDTEVLNKLRSVEIACRSELPMTEVSAKVWRNGLVYEAEKPIAFQNQTGLESDKMSFMGIQLSIEHGDNSQDAYPIYGEWGGLINTADAYRQRSVRLAWFSNKAEIKDAFWDGATITWRIPEACMLLPEDTDLPIVDNYYIDTRTLSIRSNGTLDVEDLMFNYRIREMYNTAYVNNIIVCDISLKGEKAEAKKAFSFAARGTYGTDYTLIVKPTRDRVFVPFPASPTDDFEVALYDANNKEVTNTSIELSTYPQGKIDSELFANAYNVLQATTEVPWGGKEVTLRTLYPVCYSADLEYYSSAPTRIRYNSFGTLMQLNSGIELKLFKLADNSEVRENVTWSIAGVPQGSEKYLPQVIKQDIEPIDGVRPPSWAYTLALPSMYFNISAEPYLIATQNDKVLWTSPLIIQQYRYESEILNDWDGSLKIDDDKNMVLAGSGVFGIKNEDNTFSGVVLGELSKLTPVGENKFIKTKDQTGILGFESGEQSYAFRDDGTAFIGKSGAGRIHFDGNQGIIASDSWFKDGKPIDRGVDPHPEQGALLDLKAGALFLDGADSSLHFDGNDLSLIFKHEDRTDDDVPATASITLGSGGSDDEPELGSYSGIRVNDTREGNAVFLGSTNILGEHGRKVFHAGKTKSDNIFTKKKVKGDNPLTNKINLGVQAFEIFEDGYFYAPSASIGGTPPITAQQKITITSFAGNQLYEGTKDFTLGADIGVKTTKRFDFSDREFVIAKYSWQYWSGNEWKNCTNKNGETIGSAEKTTIPFDKDPPEIGSDTSSLNPTFVFTDEDFLRWFWDGDEETPQQDIRGKFKITATIGQWEEQGVYSNEAGKVEKWYIYASDDENAKLQNSFSNDFSDEITITRIFGQKSDFTVSYYKRTSTTKTLDSEDRPTGVTFKQQNDDTKNKWYRSIPAASQENGLILDPYVWVTSATLNYKMTGKVPNTAWSTPALITDATGRLEVRYAFEEYVDTTPDNDPGPRKDWYDVAVELPPDNKTANDAIWMAVRNSYTSVVKDAEGVKWSEWTVTRIKGNDAYIISLSNDNVSVGVNVNGEPIALKQASLTEVKVLRGEQDITADDDITITWESTDCKVASQQNLHTGKKEYYITDFISNKQVATATVHVSRVMGDKTIFIGDKTMTVTKIPSTATYKLIASPQIINMAEANRKVTFEVKKYANGQVADIQSGYSIIGPDNKSLSANYLNIDDSYTGGVYTLKINDVIWDRETVDVIRGGQFTSTVFTRTDTGVKPSKPLGGSYANPLPTDKDGANKLIWSDNIPTAGGALVWFSQAVFKNTANFTATWSEPALAADEENKFNVQYCDEDVPLQLTDPLKAPWYDPTGKTAEQLQKAQWMATRSRKEGEEWSKWSVVRIKGEQGLPGTSPYTIELSNDSATIGTNANGDVDKNVLQQVSTTTVTVYEGSKDITSDYRFEWSTNDAAATLNSGSARTVYFTTMNIDNATATVKVIHKTTNQLLGSKQFTISKNKQGENATSYKLIATPNVWNSSKEVAPTITLKVMQFDGTSATTITSGYIIKVNGEDNGAITSCGITDTTTFDLYINEVLVDSETVTRVVDGQGKPGPSGTPGTSTEAVRVYYRTTSTKDIPSPGNKTPKETEINGEWTLKEMDGASEAPYVFSCTGMRTTTYKNNPQGDITYHDWTDPELYKAYNTYGVNEQNYATFLRVTNFSNEQGLKYDNNGNVIINASMIKTGSLVVAPTVKNEAGENVEDLEHPFLSIDMTGDQNGKFYAKNMSIETDFLHLDDKLFKFGQSIGQADNEESYINFSDTGSEKNSYMQSLNYGKIEASTRSILVYDPGRPQRTGVIRANGSDTTALYNYNSTTKIYLLLAEVTDSAGNIIGYTYYSKDGTAPFEPMQINDHLYGRWLKCIVVKTTDANNNITSWIEGSIYPGGDDWSAAFSRVLPGVDSKYTSSEAARKANATLKEYLTPANVTEKTLSKTISNNGSKFDLYNGRIYLGPNARIRVGTQDGHAFLAFDVCHPTKKTGYCYYFMSKGPYGQTYSSPHKFTFTKEWWESDANTVWEED